MQLGGLWVSQKVAGTLRGEGVHWLVRAVPVKGRFMANDA